MSHFLLGVILPKDAKSPTQIENFLERVMKPFDEQIEVPEYPKTCYCVGSKARGEGMTKAKSVLGAFSNIRDKYWALPEEIRNIEGMWEAFIKPFELVEEFTQKASKHYNKPDPECDECHGTGTRMSSYNPLSKWDWFVIGGRWDGYVKGAYRTSDKGFNFGDEHHKLAYNMAKVDDLLDNYPPKRFTKKSMGEGEKATNPIHKHEKHNISVEKVDEPFSCFAILTPDGKWNERGEMGWWGIVSNEKKADDWTANMKELLEAHRGHYLVGLDCHI